MNVAQHTTSTRPPVLAILASLVAGAVLAIALLVGPASGASEPMITGSVMFAFGLGWGLMAFLSTRYSAQPQPWMVVPALFLGITGLALMVFQPGPAAMDLLSWIWPPGSRCPRRLDDPASATQPPGPRPLARPPGHRHTSARGRWWCLRDCQRSHSVGTAQTAPGQMIDVGGHRLYIECTGSGSPTVVLQAGLGASSSSWASIAPKVAASTTVCAYDRAGHGHSEEAAGPQDGIALATDLHTLLERAGVAGPYVMVGHSSGGPYVRVFATQYPDEIAGMVLLDAQPAEAFTALPDYPGFYYPYRFVTALSPSLARVGLLGLLLGLSAEESTPECCAQRPQCRGGAADGARSSQGPDVDRRSAARRGHRRIRTAGRLVRGAGPDGGSFLQQRSPRHRHRHTRLAHLRRGRHHVHPGDPRRRGINPIWDAAPIKGGHGQPSQHGWSGACRTQRCQSSSAPCSSRSSVSLSRLPHRQDRVTGASPARSAPEAECRGLETRVPLQFPPLAVERRRETCESLGVIGCHVGFQTSADGPSASRSPNDDDTCR